MVLETKVWQQMKYGSLDLLGSSSSWQQQWCGPGDVRHPGESPLGCFRARMAMNTESIFFSET